LELEGFHYKKQLAFSLSFGCCALKLLSFGLWMMQSFLATAFLQSSYQADFWHRFFFINGRQF